MASLFFALWSSLFRMLRFARLLRLLVSILLPRFSACCSSGCPFLFLSPSRSGVFLSVLWTSSWVFRFLCLRLLFAFDAPPVVFHAAVSPLAVPQLSGCCLPCVSAGFLSLGFLRLLRVSSLSLGLRSLPWCLFLLVFVVVFFAPVLVLSPPVLPCYVAVAFVCMFSDLFESPVPVATWSPFGTSQVAFSLYFSWFLVACLCWYQFSACLCSVPLPCSHRGFS